MKAFERWWFGLTSPVEMGVFRMLIGFWALVNQIMVGVYFDYWFTQRGFVPIEVNRAYLGDMARINFLAGVDDPYVTLGVYILITLAAFTTCIGLWSRVSSIVLALGIITLHHRNGVILHGGDLVLRMCAIYVALSPCGKACSVDRLIALWKGRAPAIPELVSIWPQRLVQFQIGLVYFTTVWHKAFGTYWRDGTATWYPLHLNEFDRFWLPEFMQEGIFVPITTYGTLAVELALGTLVFFKAWRKWALLGGVGLHLFIEYAMNIPLFAFLMITTYLSFYEGDEVTGWAKRLGVRFRRFAAKISLPRAQRFRPGPGYAVKALDPLDLVRYEPGDAEVWKGEDAEARARNPFRLSHMRSIAAWPLAIVPGFWRKLLTRALEPKAEAARESKAKVASGGKV